MAYSTPEAVRQYTGIKPADLGFADVTGLDAWLSGRLDEITDLINTYTGRDFEADDSVPAGINGIAREMARDLVMLSVTSRETPVVRIDDWRVRIAEPAIFTSAIKEALKHYRKKLPFRMFRVRREDEIEV